MSFVKGIHHVCLKCSQIRKKRVRAALAADVEN